MTEKQLQDAVVQAAHTFGWLVYHTYDSRRNTPGFPDLVLARNGEVIFAELKSEKGRVRPEQAKWMEHMPVMVWRPVDWTNGAIVEVLR